MEVHLKSAGVDAHAGRRKPMALSTAEDVLDQEPDARKGREREPRIHRSALNASMGESRVGKEKFSPVPMRLVMVAPWDGARILAPGTLEFAEMPG